MQRAHPIIALSVLAAGLTWAGASVPEAPAAAPELNVPLSPSSPRLDGALTDACWQGAVLVPHLRAFPAAGSAVGHQVHAIHDGRWLYLGVAVAHPDPEHIQPSVFEADGSVQADDSVEIFLDPGSGGAFYVHYVLNAANIKSDQVVFREGGRERAGRTPWRSATRLTARGWIAEMAFPLQELTRWQKTHAGDWAKARLNVCVTTIKPLFDAFGARMAEEKRLATWAPVVGGFHDPERFGFLRGIQPDSAAPPLFLPTLAGARVGAYELRGGEAGYRMVVSLRNGGKSTGQAEVVVADRPVGASPGEVQRKQELAAGQEMEAALRVPLAAPGPRTALVWLKDAANGGAFDSRLLDEQAMQAADPFAAWLDRSYYTTETHAQALCRVRLPENATRGQKIVVRDEAGRTIGQTTRLAEECRIPIALAPLAVGRHLLTIEWLGKGGERLAQRAVALTKQAPNPGCEVKIDQEHGVVLRDGRPVFPFGLIASGLESGDDEYFKRLADAGYNALVWWGRKPGIGEEEYRAYLETARKHGLFVVDAAQIHPLPPHMASLRQSRGLKVFDKTAFSEQEEMEIALADLDHFLPNLRKAWAVAREAPNLLGYWNVDEPNLGSPDKNIAVAERFYRELRKVDSYHPVVLLYACNIPPGARWTEWGEILGYDPYVYPGWDRFDYGTPNFVAQKTIQLRRRAESAQRAVWILPMANSMDPARTPRILRPEEQECQTYLALIHGAKGIFYFVNTALYARSSWDALSRLAEQVKVLAPALTAPAVPREVTYRPGELDADKRLFPEVQAALFQHPDGRHILLAANSASYPVTVSFRVGAASQQPSASLREVEGLFAGDPYPVRAGAFGDDFAPYAVRAYVLKGLDTRGGKASITVSAQGHPEKEAVEKPFPVGEFAKRKNGMPNPSLEIMSVPGVPDYIRPNMYLTWPLVGDPDARWGIDTDRPFHGKYCLRLAHQVKGGEPPNANFRITTGVCYIPSLPAPTRYTLSLYARAQREREELAIHVVDMDPQAPEERWKVTRDWQRYSFTSTFRAGGHKTFYLYTFSKDAVVWIDALQIEAGESATEFAPD